MHLESPDKLCQSLMHHLLEVLGNPKVMHCGVVLNMLYFKLFCSVKPSAVRSVLWFYDIIWSICNIDALQICFMLASKVTLRPLTNDDSFKGLYIKCVFTGMGFVS